MSVNRREMITGTAAAIGGVLLCSTASAATEEISRAAEAIHQETLFSVAPKRVYEVLTNGTQFHEVEKLSGAMRSGMKLGDKPAAISHEAGGAFTIFGGHIIGRHIELVPGRRVVQAWRVADWAPGIYSIAKFELMEHDKGTMLIFDHTGFPAGQAEHLAAGWKANYWEAMQKYLA